jgi:hypothetical protein
VFYDGDKTLRSTGDENSDFSVLYQRFIADQGLRKIENIDVCIQLWRIQWHHAKAERALTDTHRKVKNVTTSAQITPISEDVRSPVLYAPRESGTANRIRAKTCSSARFLPTRSTLLMADAAASTQGSCRKN